MMHKLANDMVYEMPTAEEISQYMAMSPDKKPIVKIENDESISATKTEKSEYYIKKGSSQEIRGKNTRVCCAVLISYATVTVSLYTGCWDHDWIVGQ